MNEYLIVAYVVVSVLIGALAATDAGFITYGEAAGDVARTAAAPASAARKLCPLPGRYPRRRLLAYRDSGRATMKHLRRFRNRYRHALRTTLHRSRLLSALWALGWVKDGRG